MSSGRSLPAAPMPERPRRRAVAYAAPSAVAALTAAAYVAFAGWQWSVFAVRSWDLSIFTQAVKSYAAMRPPIVDIKGAGFNLLGDHFHPALALLAPLYALFPHAFTLLVVQAACFAAGAAVITRAASRKVDTVSGVLLGLAFGASWGLQYAAEAQFHEVALAVPLLAASLWAVVDGRFVSAAAWAAPLVFVKEDLGLTVGAIGILVAARSGRHVLGASLTLWGVIWFAVATLVIIPALNPGGAWAYGGAALPAGLNEELQHLFDPAKLQTIALLILISAAMIFRSSISLILLPTLGWRFLSPNAGYWGPSWHYSAVLMPIVFIALIDAHSSAGLSRWAWMRAYRARSVAVAATAALVLLPTLPVHQAFDSSAWAGTARTAAARQALEAIPAGVTVESDIGLMSYVVDGHETYWIGNQNPAPGCIVIDRIAGGTPADWGDVQSVAARLHPDLRYSVRYRREGYEVACRTR